MDELDLEEQFLQAVREGDYEFIEEHIDEIDLTNDDGSCPYLDETDDENIKQMFYDCGVLPELDSFESGYRFAVDTVNWFILTFDPKLREEALTKAMEELGIPKDIAIARCEYGEDWELEYYDDDEEEDEDNSENDTDTDDRDEDSCTYDWWSFNDVMRALHVEVENGDFLYPEVPYMTPDGDEAKELLENLGYEFESIGREARHDSAGVVYLK